jgi:hypothetical protein
MSVTPDRLRIQRLAVAFVLHRHRDDIQAMNGVLDDVRDGETATALLLSVANLADYAMREVCGPHTEQSLLNMINGLAEAEGNQP